LSIWDLLPTDIVKAIFMLSLKLSHMGFCSIPRVCTSWKRDYDKTDRMRFEALAASPHCFERLFSAVAMRWLDTRFAREIGVFLVKTKNTALTFWFTLCDDGKHSHLLSTVETGETQSPILDELIGKEMVYTNTHKFYTKIFPLHRTQFIEILWRTLKRTANNLPAISVWNASWHRVLLADAVGCMFVGDEDGDPLPFPDAMKLPKVRQYVFVCSCNNKTTNIKSRGNHFGMYFTNKRSFF